jgi:F-type H+-transporting ATPase subunit c
MLVLALPLNAQTGAPSNWTYAALGLGLAVALAAYGQSRVASSVAESIARNPGARPGIQLALFLGLAFIESLVLFIWVMLLFKAK